MDWIEKLFGIAPDGGSGLSEFLFLAIPVMGLLLVLKPWLGRRLKVAFRK